MTKKLYLVPVVLLALAALACAVVLLPSNVSFLDAVWLAGAASLAVMVYSGNQFFTGMWASLKHRTANMHTLIALGTR